MFENKIPDWTKKDLDSILKKVIENKFDKYGSSRDLREDELAYFDFITGVPREVWTYMYDYERIPKHTPRVDRMNGLSPKTIIAEQKKLKASATKQAKQKKKRELKPNPFQPSKIVDTSVLPDRHSSSSSFSGVRCPYCGSKSTRRIGTTSRMVSTGVFGLASSKIGKQWHCNNCRSDF